MSTREATPAMPPIPAYPPQAPAYPARQQSSAGAWVAAAIVIAISLLSTFTVSTDDATDVAAGGVGPQLVPVGPGTDLGIDPNAATGGGTGKGGRRVGGGGGEDVAGTEVLEGGSEGSGGAGSAGSAKCEENQNAGESDIGVKQNEINFAATVVKTGIAVDFLSDAQFGIEAMIQKTNRDGGVCGRLIRVKYDDDGWDLAKGGEIIQKYINEKKYFGLAVNPSSEGLLGASGHIKGEGMPAIGADGMLIDQYQNPWIWPVATSTHSVMHIMCSDAIARNAQTLAIVWENNYRFGVEGAKAFEGCVRRAGKTLKANQSIAGGQQAYNTQVNQFHDACGAQATFANCDFVALLLEPATASTWRKSNGMGNGDHYPSVGFGAPQPLFVNSFVKDCGKPCANIRVWTSFKPPIDPFDKDPAVQTYRNDLRAVSSSADDSNPHVEGAYVGMLLLVDALKKAGPAPTREKIKQILDSTTLDTGLAPPLKFSEGNHFAATSAQAFEAIYNITTGSATFTSWRYTNTGFKNDPDAGIKEDLPS